MTYTIGDDIICQTDGSDNTEFFLYDGQGSTRQLVDDSDPVTVNDSYSYDAYGVMLGGNPTASSPASTSLLYTGEQFDEHAQQYYLRARYYNPMNGRFNRTDPFAGSPQDPQSLHKYLYAHCNPVNVNDPSGMTGEFSIGGLVTFMATWVILSTNYATAPTEFSQGIPDATGDLVVAALLTVVTAGAVAFVGHFFVRPLANRFSGLFRSKGLQKSVVVSKEKAKTILKKNGFSDDVAKSYVEAFDGPIEFRIVEPGEKFVRYTDVANSKGRWLTNVEFSSPDEAFRALYLEPYNNCATLIQEVHATGRSLVLQGGITNGATGIDQIFIISSEPVFEFGIGLEYPIW